MTSDLNTPHLPRDTIQDATRNASGVKMHNLAWLEFERPDLDRDAVDQAAGKAVVDTFTIPWKLEIQP